MAGENHHPPGVGTLLRKLAATGLGALRNRGELLTVEWQEEKARQVHLAIASVALMAFAFLATALLTAIVIFLFPQDKRLYVAGAFALLYVGGAVWSGFTLKRLFKSQPFSESLNQLKKDREWLDSFD